MNWLFVAIGLGILGLLLAVVLLQFMVYALMRRVLRAGARLAIVKAWATVSKEVNPVLKIVQADKVLDEALKLLGYEGTLGEKLKKAGPRFSNLNAVWAAHKLRNTVVHALDSKPEDAEVDRAVESIRSALNDLGAKL